MRLLDCNDASLRLWNEGEALWSPGIAWFTEGQYRFGEPAWPQRFKEKVRHAENDKPYVVDRIGVPLQNPWGSMMMANLPKPMSVTSLHTLAPSSWALAREASISSTVT